MAHRLKIASCPRRARRLAIAACSTLSVAATLLLPAQAQQVPNPCGELTNPYGPFEYRPDHYKPGPYDHTTHASKLHLVESAHFTVPVQTLTAGATSAKPGPDLDYTLRAFPNNHRALVTVMNAARRYSDATEIGLPRSFECYFDRALRFAPDDALARLLYATFLIQKKRVGDAKKQIDHAATLAGDNSFTHLNVGLIYFDAGDYDKALKQAHIAAELGSRRQDLKDRLKAIGRWTEPETASPAASQSSAPARAP